MSKTQPSRIVLLLWLGVFCISALAPLSQALAQQDDSVLGLIPADCLLCLRVNNLDGSLLQTDEFLAGVSPVSLSMIGKMGLGSLLGNPMMSGVDTSGSFAVFVTVDSAQGQGAMPVVAGLIPVSDYSQFISGNPDNTGPEPDSDGLAKMSGQGTPGLLTCSLGRYALVGLADNRDGLLALKQKISAKSASLAGVVDTVQAGQAQQMPLWLFCNIQEVNRAFGPMIQMQLQRIKGMMQQQMTAQGQLPKGPDPAKLLDVYLSVVDTLLKETLSVTVSVKPSRDALLLSKSLKAKPGSGLADLFPTVSGRGFDTKMFGYLPDGAAFNMAMRMSIPAWLEINTKVLDWLATGLGDSLSKQDTDAMKTMMADVAAALGQSGVFSLMLDQAAKPPMQMRYALEVKDAAKLNALIDRGTEMFNHIWADFYRSMGMQVDFKLKRAIAKYQGVSIDSASLSLQVNDKDAPQAALINRMYGDGFEYRWAVTDKLVLSAVGSQADTQLKQMIDRTLSGGDVDMPREMKEAVALLPQTDRANMIMTLNVLRFWSMIKAMAPVPLPDVPVKTRSNIAIATTADSGRFTLDLAVPKTHVIEIRDVVLAMMAQNKQQ